MSKKNGTGGTVLEESVVPKRRSVEVNVHEIKREIMNVRIVGESSLIVHNFCRKAQAQMLAKQCHVTWPKEAKDPVAQFEGATHYIDDKGFEIPCNADLALIYEGKVKEFLEIYAKDIANLRARKNPIFGFPSVGIKACMIRGAKSLGLVMADMKGALFIPREFVTIEGGRTLRSDMVRIAMNTPDIRFRPEFWPWSMQFDVVYNAAVVTPDLVINMLNAGGFSCGIGEWRPEKGGSHGMFGIAR